MVTETAPTWVNSELAIVVFNSSHDENQLSSQPLHDQEVDIGLYNSCTLAELYFPSHMSSSYFSFICPLEKNTSFRPVTRRVKLIALFIDSYQNTKCSCECRLDVLDVCKSVALTATGVLCVCVCVCVKEKPENIPK